MSLVENRTVRWSAGAGLVCLLLVAATWFLLVTPRQSAAADLAAQRVSTQNSNDALRVRIEELRVQYGKLPEARSKLEEIRRQIPATVDMPVVVRGVDGLAKSAGVRLISLTRGTAEDIAAAPAPAAAASAGSAGSAGAAEGSGSGTAAAAGGAAASATSVGLVGIPVAITVKGDYFQTVAFLRKLQTELPRAFLVAGLEITQGEASEPRGTVKVTINGRVFSRTDPTAAASGTASGSAASGSAAGSAAGTSAGGAATPAASPAATSAGAPSPAATDGAPLAVGPTASDSGTGSLQW